MAMIQITPESLRSKAAEVRSLKSTHDETMNRLKNLVHGLSSEWKGEAQDAFLANFDGMQAKFTQFSEMLEGYAKLMDTAATDMQGADTGVKAKVQSFT